MRANCRSLLLRLVGGQTRDADRGISIPANRRVDPWLRGVRWPIRVGVSLLLLGATFFPPVEHRVAKATTAPSIVLILTDDQRWDTLWAMPNVQSDLVAHGINLINAFVVNSLCCPSRASILTGQYSHGTQVYDNSGPYGGYSAFHGGASTIATWLKDAGYRTGLMGKYLNDYRTTEIPPGWDRWVAFRGPNGSYFNYDLNIDGNITHYGAAEANYSTSVLAAKADSFVRRTPNGQPLFLYFAPFAPHGPATPLSKYMGEFRELLPYRPPNYNEADVSDKPSWVQSLPLLSSETQAAMDTERRKSYQTLLSVDEAVHTIVTALTDTGRLSNTLIVFASDNGVAIGEHRWRVKRGAYDEQIRIPLVVRYDPLIATARSDDHLVTNIDLAPTFAAAAGVASPDADGMSMLPLLTDPGSPWRQDFLVEHLRNVDFSTDVIPTFCAIRNETYLYNTYGTGEEELYELSVDPYELDNLASDPAYATTVASLRTRLVTLCDPLPPGFTFPYDMLPPA
jgi:N-acetylglucosamine-6-sulfatase